MLCFVLRFAQTDVAEIQDKTATAAGPGNEMTPRKEKKTRSAWLQEAGRTPRKAN